MKSDIKQKEIFIEVLRFIACFLVIMAHIQLKPVISEGCFSWKRICFSSIIGDNVPIFFLITGFYMFKNIKSDESILMDWKGKIKGFLLRIWLPALIIVVLTCMIEPWLNGQDMNQSVQWDTLQKFVFRNSSVGASGHLWYVCVYVKFIVFFPFLAFICQNKPINARIRRIYILFSLFHVILSDIEYLLQKEIADFSMNVFDNYTLYLLIGNELYIFLNSKWCDSRKNILYGGGAYIAGNIMKFACQYYAFNCFGTGIKSWYMGLECFPCYISSCGLFLLFFSLRNIDWKCGRVWIFLGKYSFYVYLCHLIVIKRLQSFQVQSYFIDVHKGGVGLIHIGLYYLELGFIVFLISLLIGIFFKKIYGFTLIMFGNVYGRHRNGSNEFGNGINSGNGRSGG